jgi:flagellin
MGLRIKTNVTSLIAQRRLGESTKKLGDSLEKLSSGQRINKSADDAAGLAISERIRARMKGLGQAKRNASDGISYIQVAEGGLNETTNILVRMRELATQAASDTIGNRERDFLNREFTQLRDEVGRIVDSTEFNGSKVLQAGDGDQPIQIFVGASDRGRDLNGDAPDIDGDNDPDILNIELDDLTLLAEQFEEVTDSDMMILPEGADDITASELGPNGDTNELFTALDSTLNAIASYRATLGSVQSRLNSTITNIEITNENMAAAQSRIRDVDYASETAKFAQARILQSAGVSTLTQANASGDAVLALLRG